MRPLVNRSTYVYNFNNYIIIPRARVGYEMIDSQRGAYIYLLKTGSLDNTIQDFLVALPLCYMSQYTIISKYGKHTHQLKFKKEVKNFPSRNNGDQRKSLRARVE